MGLANLQLLILVLTCTLISHSACDPEEDTHPEGHPPGHGHKHWSYKDILEWDKAFPDCGGRDQSPIDVITQEVTYDPSLKAIGLSGYNLTPEDSLKLENNGHTVSLKLPESLEIVEGLSHTYRAAQLHFHWGSHGSPGSEHAVNGQKFPGEIHVVHYSSLYGSIDEAQGHPGGLAVLAAFIQLSILEDTLHHDHDHILQMNFRDPQSLSGRIVLSSFRPPVSGRKAGGEAPSPPASGDGSSSNGADRGAQGADDPALGTGDMLAIIFAVLFLVTAVAFFIYVRRNRNPRSSDKSNVIYKATKAEDTMA